MLQDMNYHITDLVKSNLLDLHPNLHLYIVMLPLYHHIDHMTHIFIHVKHDHVMDNFYKNYSLG